jgi:hypothetical protein
LDQQDVIDLIAEIRGELSKWVSWIPPKT